MSQRLVMFRDRMILGLLCTGFIMLEISLYSQIFVDEALERGVDAVVFANSLSSPGISAVDFDQDGDDDITMISDGEAFFYLNQGGQFELIELGIDPPPGDGGGAVWADINNDGHLDILLTSFFGGIRLFKNLGELSFVDITETCGISNEVTSNWGVSFSDVDRDGFVDLQLCRYETEPEIPDDPSILPELWTRLYRNNGDDTFTDYTQESGLIIEPSPAFLGVFLDFNNDLWPDNYTIVDRIQGNKLFVNNQGTFSDITDEYEASYPNNDIMSNTVGDYNNDGYLDIFMTNDAEETFLLENDQGQSLTNVAEEVGVSVDVFGWGAVWIDADNDGWQDLFFAIPALAPNYFFVNNEGFFIRDELAIEQQDQVPSYCAAKGDFNGDGYYDMIVQSKSPYPASVLINLGGENHFVKLTPHGTVSNSMAIGSWVKVYANGQQYVHFTLCGEGYISQNSQHLIFGLGEETSEVDSVTIRYASGHLDSYYNLPTDSAYHFYEGETYQVNIIPDDSLICEGDQAILDAGEHFSYLWSTGDTTRSISVDTAGVYSVNVINAFGVSASNNFELTFQPLPVISESVSPNICFGDSTAVIDLENLLETPAESVTWENGMTGASIDSLLSGEYTYVFTDVNGCVDSGSVSVIDPSELVVFATGNPADIGESNGSIDVTVFGGVTPYVIALDGDTIVGSIGELTAGTYTIAVIDAFGCVVVVEVDVDSTLGSTAGDIQESVVICPNLLHSGQHLNMKIRRDVKNLTFKVRDISGKLLFEEEFQNLAIGQHMFALANFAKGIYIYELSVDENFGSGKLIVQ